MVEYMYVYFIEYGAGVDPLDITTILSQGGGGPVYPLPRIIDILVHPKLNLATLLFAVRHSRLRGSKKMLVLMRCSVSSLYLFMDF